MTEVHSTRGASSAHRWLNCPGSPNLIATLPVKDKPSVYAMEGTIAHELGEVCLVRRHPAKKYLNWIGWINENGGGGVQAMEAPGSIYSQKIDSEMVNAVQLYLDTIDEDLKNTIGGELLVEQKFHLDWIDDDLWGTNDAAIVQEFGLLRVYDFKYGRGVPVEVEDNPQLLYYAVGALGKDNEHQVDYIEMSIVQPRAPHSDGPVRRTAQWPVRDVYAWANDVLKPGVDATRPADAPRKRGDWCRFCPASAICPEMKSQADDLLGGFFSAASDTPLPSMVDDAYLLRILKDGDAVIAHINTCVALAQSRMEMGRKFPGFKLVEKRATRKWANEEKAWAHFHITEPRDAFDLTLKSPAQIEAVYKERGLKKEDIQTLLAPLVEKKSSGLTIVPVSDKRPEAAPPATFTAVPSSGDDDFF